MSAWSSLISKMRFRDKMKEQLFGGSFLRRARQSERRVVILGSHLLTSKYDRLASRAPHFTPDSRRPMFEAELLAFCCYPIYLVSHQPLTPSQQHPRREAYHCFSRAIVKMKLLL